MKPTTLDPRTTDVRLIEAEGFRDGANGVEKDAALQEIDAAFARRQAEVREQAAVELGDLEGEAKTLKAFAQEAEARWEAVRNEHGHDLPRLFMPLVVFVLSWFAIAAEAILIAPLLDMIGIADRTHQLWAAAAIVLIAALIFDYYFKQKEEGSPILLAAILAIATLVGLTLVGLMRGEQLTFVAEVSGNPLAEFLHTHPWLRQGVFVFLTLFFPIAASVGLYTSTGQMHQWWRFRKTRRRAETLTPAANQAEHSLEGRKEELAQQLAQLEEQAEEWKSVYATYHRLGEARGASRPPRWFVWAKATAVAVLVLVPTVALSAVLLGSIAPLGLMLSTLFAAAVWLGAAVFFYRRWEHPSAIQYLKWARLEFREASHRKPGTPPAAPVLVPDEASEKLLSGAVQAQTRQARKVQ